MLGLWAAQEAWQLQQRAINRDGWAPNSRCGGSSPTAYSRQVGGSRSGEALHPCVLEWGECVVSCSP